jgi:hypothetical protein
VTGRGRIAVGGGQEARAPRQHQLFDLLGVDGRVVNSLLSGVNRPDPREGLLARH